MSSRALAKRQNATVLAAAHNAQQALLPSPTTSTTHRMTTRSRAAQFPLLRLPAELRNRIYTLALTSPADEALALRELTIPPLLQTSRQLRREAMGLLTAVNEVEVVVRCSYCVVGGHVAGSGRHKFFNESGLLVLDDERRAWLEKGEGVFRRLEIEVLCCCCATTGLGIFRIQVGEGAKCAVECKVGLVREQEVFERVFEGIEGKVRAVLREAEGREGFVGLGLEDLEKVAACFRWVEESD